MLLGEGRMRGKVIFHIIVPSRWTGVQVGFVVVTLIIILFSVVWLIFY